MKKTNNIIIAVVFGLVLPMLCCSAIAAAQSIEPLVSIAHSEPERAQNLEDWQGSILFGFDFAQGNTESMLFDVSGTLSGEKKRNIWRLSGGHRFGQSGDETDTDSSDALADYKRLLSQRTYLGFTSGFSRDVIADVSYRVTLSPTVGYFLVKDPDERLNVELGPGYLFEKVGDIEDDYFNPYLGQRYEVLASSSAKLFEAGKLYYDARESENVLLTAQAGIQTSITKVLSLVVMVEDTFDNRPAEGKEKNDIKLLTSLAYHF